MKRRQLISEQTKNRFQKLAGILNESNSTNLAAAKKVVVQFGYNSRGIDSKQDVKEMDFENEESFVERCLLHQFDNDEEELVDFWGRYSAGKIKTLDDAVKDVITNKQGNRYWTSDEGFAEIIDIK